MHPVYRDIVINAIQLCYNTSTFITFTVYPICVNDFPSVFGLCKLIICRKGKRYDCDERFRWKDTRLYSGFIFELELNINRIYHVCLFEPFDQYVR